MIYQLSFHFDFGALFLEKLAISLSIKHLKDHMKYKRDVIVSQLYYNSVLRVM